MIKLVVPSLCFGSPLTHVPAVQAVFISHPGTLKDSFAAILRTQLLSRGITVFLDERSLLVGQQSDPRMKKACVNAKLVIFVITKEFLASSYCMDEVHWALGQHSKSKPKLPQIMTVLYHKELVPGYTQKEIKDMRQDELRTKLRTPIVKVSDLGRLSGSLLENVKGHSKPKQQQRPWWQRLLRLRRQQPGRQHNQQQEDEKEGGEREGEGPGEEDILTLEDRLADLKQLGRFCLQRDDACAR